MSDSASHIPAHIPVYLHKGCYLETIKTTVEVAGPLFDAARAYCVDNGLAFRQLVESCVGMAMIHPTPSTNFHLRPFGFQGQGQAINDWAEIRDPHRHARRQPPTRGQL